MPVAVAPLPSESLTVLRLPGITKCFGTLTANDNISLTPDSGEVLALLGENGVGNSTLMSNPVGPCVADEGRIKVFGQSLPPVDPKAVVAAGVGMGMGMGMGMVHQHFTLADNLTVLENLMFGTEPPWQPVSHRAAARAKLVEVDSRVGLPVQPDSMIGIGRTLLAPEQAE